MKSSKKLQILSHLLFVYTNNQDRKWHMSVLVFSSALARCVDLMLVPVRLATLRIDKSAGCRRKRHQFPPLCLVWFFCAFITLPVSQNFFTSREIDDLFGTCASSYSAVNTGIVSVYDFVAR